MADESIGSVGLEIEISQRAAHREAIRAGGTIQKALGGSLQATDKTIKNMFSGLSRGGRAGSESVGLAASETKRLSMELDTVNALIRIQEQKLFRLRQQYQYLSDIGMKDSGRGLKLQEQIVKAERNVLRLTKASEKTAQALWKVDDALRTTGETGETASKKLVSSGKDVERTYNQVGSSASKMATTLKRSLTRVLRQVFIIAVLYKAVRGLMDYVGSALKTNTEFSRSLEIIKTNLAVAFQPIIRAVIPIITSLVKWLATATTYVAAFISAIFGKSYKDNFDAAQQIYQAKDAMDAYGDAANKAKKSLMGFDEINTLQTPDNSAQAVPSLVMPDITEAENRVSGLLSILGGIGSKFSWVGQIFSDVWNTIIRPILNHFKNIGSESILVVRALWDKHGTGLVDGASKYIDNLAKTWNLLWTNILEPIIRPFLGENSALWDGSFSSLLAIAGDFVLGMANRALEFYNKFIFPIIQWLIVEFGPKVVQTFHNFMLVMGLLRLFVDNAIKGVKRSFGGLIDFIAGVFSGDWERAWLGVKDIFGGIFDAFEPLVKKPLQAVIDAVNKMIDGLNKLSFSIPSWVPGNLGGKSFGLNIPSIPHLARGGIVDQPTLAMIGERGKEAVVPLENTPLVEKLAAAVAGAVLQVMQMVGGQGTGQAEREVILELDAVKLARILLPRLNNELVRQGARPLIRTT